MAKVPKDLVDAICESIRARPEEWTVDWSSYEPNKVISVRHESGVSVGCPCHCSMIDVYVRGLAIDPGFNSLGFLVPWRRRLASAAQTIIARHTSPLNVALDRALLALRGPR